MDCCSLDIVNDQSHMSILYIKGFYVTSYQANFASHHTRDCHDGFLFTRSGIGKCNKMSRYFLFNSYHNTKLQLSDEKISTHSFEILILSMKWIKSFKRFLVVFLYTASYKKETKRWGKIVCVWVQTLYTSSFLLQLIVWCTLYKCLDVQETDIVLKRCSHEIYNILKLEIIIFWELLSVQAWKKNGQISKLLAGKFFNLK